MGCSAIVAPSINPAPAALAELRRIAPDALLIVVGDLKAPAALGEYCAAIGARYLGVREQEQLTYRSTRRIPWNCVMRRNLGNLEAIRLGAERIIMVDDDNLPLEDSWMDDWEHIFGGEIEANQVEADEFFNPGCLADRPYYSRGFPYSYRGCYGYRMTYGKGRAGIANGRILGDPDINATERIEKAPEVKGYRAEAQDGLMFEPARTWIPINTQNTAYGREFLPLAFALPNVGRYDDIWATFIAQRVMEATDYRVYFGKPAMVQTRNAHNLFRDLQAELMGMEHTEAFCRCLKEAPVTSRASVLDNLFAVAEHLRTNWPLPFPHDFLEGWIEDVGGLL